MTVPLSQIEADLKKNVRNEIPDVSGLAESIEEVGLLQPIGVRASRDADGNIIPDRYTVVYGYRRYLALKKADVENVPVYFVDPDEKKDLARKMIENLQRADMTPLEKAQGMQRMLEDEGLDQKSIARRLGMTDGFVSQHLALLKLPKQVQSAVQFGKVSLTEARELYRLREHEKKMLETLAEVGKISLTELKEKVDVFLERERVKEEKAAEKAAEKEKGAGTKGAKRTDGDADDDSDVDTAPKRTRKSLVEQYEEAEIKPLAKTALREKLMAIALKYDNAKSAEKQKEYKLILKGMEMAAGLAE